MTLKVSGATLYYEVRGSGPLLVLSPGGPTDADVMAPLAEFMASKYRVVTYDPRGNSRSVFDTEPEEQNMNTHGDDLAVLIASFGSEPAFVFGNSGGAQIGLNFSARYPALCQRLVAHEPPCIPLLPNADEVLEQMRNVVALYHSAGVGPAMAEFAKIVGVTPPPRSGDSQSERAVRMENNVKYFVEHGVLPIASFKPNIEKLRNVVVGAGRESEGQLAHQTAQALADRLHEKLVLFPKDHSSWARDPGEFSRVLMSVLK